MYGYTMGMRLNPVTNKDRIRVDLPFFSLDMED